MVACFLQCLYGALFVCVCLCVCRLDASHSRALCRAKHTGCLPSGWPQPGTMATREQPLLGPTVQVRPPYTHTHTHTQTHTHTHTHTQPHTYTCAHTHTHIYMHTHTAMDLEN